MNREDFRSECFITTRSVAPSHKRTKWKKLGKTCQGTQFLLEWKKDYLTQVSEEIEVRVSEKTVPGVQQDQGKNSELFIELGRFCSENTSSDTTQKGSRDFPEIRQEKPWVQRGLFRERLSFWGGYFDQQVPPFSDFRPWPGKSYDEKSSRGNHLLQTWEVIKQATEHACVKPGIVL